MLDRRTRRIDLLSRAIRRVLVALAVSVLAAASPGQQVDFSSGSAAQSVAKLKPGEFVWAPQLAPKGPLLLIVNIASQRALLFRNGVPIAASTVSTGRAGHETPTGIFTVLQRQVEHYSSLYDNAPMAYMQRLTWQGVALHAGNLPGYPASHGCIRLPKEFAKLLYGTTTLGMTVAILDQPAVPRIAPGPAILNAPTVGREPTGAIEWHPDSSPTGPVSIVISASDRRAIVLRNGIVIGSAPVELVSPVAGTWAYALRSVDAEGQHWMRIDLSSGAASNQPIAPGEWRRFKAPAEFRRAVAAILAPGTTIVVTADSLRSGAVAEPVTVIEGEPNRN